MAQWQSVYQTILLLPLYQLVLYITSSSFNPACALFLCYSQDNCRLTYNANGATGWYAAALQVEDFISASSTVAMSSVPVQFLILVQVITIPPGVTNPTFVGSTPVDGSCITIGSTYQQQITARSGGDSAT